MFRRLIRHPAVQAPLATLLGLYLALVARTTRWTLLGEQHARGFANGRTAIAAFWHERLAVVPTSWPKLRHRVPNGAAIRPHVLVSRHRDGRLIGAVAERFGATMVYASSSRGGAIGLRALLRLLRDGELIMITPDGPRGPRRVAAPGVAQLAAASGVPILPCAAATSARILLRSWDRAMLPLPFGRGVLVLGAPIAVPRDGAKAALPAIEAALTAACDAADAGVA
jgi:lysophospholipid acyltransferase (LPLAT)-like uncharacterized protein